MNRVQVVGASGASGGGVAYSRARVIPWKKRIDAGFKQKGGAVFSFGLSDAVLGGLPKKKSTTRGQKGGYFDMGPGGIFGNPRQKGGGWYKGVLNKKNSFYRKNQKGGGWFDSFVEGMTGVRGPVVTRNKQTKKQRKNKMKEYQDYHKKQKGGFSRVIAHLERKKSQKGGGWFDTFAEGMTGVKRNVVKRDKKPTVIHSAAKSYPQKGGYFSNSQAKVDRSINGVYNLFGVKRSKKKKQKGGVLGLGKLEKWYGGKSKKEREEIDTWTAKNL